MRLPYFYQQVLGFLSVILVLLLITGLSLLRFSRTSALNDTEETLFAYGEALVEGNLKLEQLNYAQDLLDNQGIDLAIFDNEGERAYPLESTQPAPYLSEESKEQLRRGQRLSLTIQEQDLHGNERETALVYLPFFSQETSAYAGYVAVSAPVSWIDEEIQDLQSNLLYAFLFSSLGALVISLVFASYQVNRVNQLRKAAHQVTSGNFDIRLDHKERDEVDDLIEDFNTMVAALKDYNQEVARQEERRKDFMADAAHEMRTPLTTINGLLEGLEYDVIPEEQKHRSIKLMQKETRRLIRLVNENLDYENIRSNRIVLNKQEFQVKEVVESVTEQLRESAEESNNRLQIDVGEDVWVYADYDRFTQILVNLVRNAVQFTENGLIQVRAHVKEGNTIVTVADSGIGMTEEQMKNMWDRYYKADLSRTNKKYGESGLGMAIVQQLVRLHGASIHVDSKPNEGTSFTLTFPHQPLDTEE